MKPKEKDFCRLMAVFGDPESAARLAGYRRPETRWQKLLCRGDIAKEISANARALRTVYEDTAVCGLYRLAFGRPSEAIRLLYREDPTDIELDELDLSGISEIKRTKDKSVEIRFFDRIKALEKLHEILNSSKENNSAGGLIDAMRLSAQTLGQFGRHEDDVDGD